MLGSQRPEIPAVGEEWSVHALHTRSHEGGLRGVHLRGRYQLHFMEFNVSDPVEGIDRIRINFFYD